MPAKQRVSSKNTNQLRRAIEDLKMLKLPCGICTQPIDYSLPPNHPDAFQADHIKPRKLFPHLANDFNNLQASHASCNNDKSFHVPEPIIGETSRDW